MSKWIRPVMGLAAALACGAAVAAPPTKEAGEALLNRYDVSFQDGRTSSQIGWGGRVQTAIAGTSVTGDPDDRGPLSACFDAEHPPTPEAMQAIEDMMRTGYGGRYLVGSSWNGGANTTRTLTWSFVPDGLSIPGGAVQGEATAPSVLFARMDALYGAANRATWIQQFQNCFNRWSALSGVTYVHVQNAAGNDWDDGAAWGTGGGPNRGDIRISMHNIDNVNGVLAYCSFPTAGDMVIDSSENWAQGAPAYRFLRNVVSHEHGHGLGFSHVCPATGSKLMEPFISTAYDGPQQDDIRAIEYDYGDPYEPNNNPASAYDLGTLAAGSTTTLGNVPSPAVTNAATLCISTSTDSDYFVFNLADPRLVDVTVTPVGSTYAMYAQDANCNTTTANDNALAAANLNITIYNANGSTVLRTQDAAGAGSGETISGLLLASGNNYIKVAATNYVEAQLYRLTVTVRGTNLAPTASDGTYDDHVHIFWPAISDATNYQVYRNVSDAQFLGQTIANVTPPATTFDDTTAQPGQLYYYFVKVLEPGSTVYRFTADHGDTGYIDIPPVANAGPDQTVTDTDNNGSESVLLDGSASTHEGEGFITGYRWNEGATILAQSGTPTASVVLPVGVHTITLTVTDLNNFTGTDDVVVTVAAPGGGSCGSADFNCDGDVGTDADIQAFFLCLSGSCPSAPCNSTADFNGDGNVGTDADIEAFFRVLGGGTC